MCRLQSDGSRKRESRSRNWRNTGQTPKSTRLAREGRRSDAGRAGRTAKRRREPESARLNGWEACRCLVRGSSASLDGGRIKGDITFSSFFYLVLSFPPLSPQAASTASRSFLLSIFKGALFLSFRPLFFTLRLPFLSFAAFCVRPLSRRPSPFHSFQLVCSPFSSSSSCFLICRLPRLPLLFRRSSLRRLSPHQSRRPRLSNPRLRFPSPLLFVFFSRKLSVLFMFILSLSRRMP